MRRHQAAASAVWFATRRVWGSRQRGIGFALNRFGLLTQRLTTARPDAAQIEVAIAAVELCRALPAPREAEVAAVGAMATAR